MLPGLAQSWITVVLCTLPFMANRGTGRGEEGNQHTRGPALLRLTWDRPTSAFSPPGIERRIGLPGVVSFGQPCPTLGFAPDDDALLISFTLPKALFYSMSALINVKLMILEEPEVP